MLKVEYPCRDILSSYQNPVKPVLTWTEAKKHLQDVRLRRQKQLATSIDECQKLRSIHQQIFNRQFDSNSLEKSSLTKPINNENSVSVRKYSIPRIEHASLIYRQAEPIFELDKSIHFDNEVPIARELTEYLTELPFEIPKTRIEKRKEPQQQPQQSHASVSSVLSTDKRANRVYEKWPDYNQISDIVGYRIDPPAVKTTSPATNTSVSSDKLSQRKSTKSLAVPRALKQDKKVVGLSPLLARRQSLKNKKSTKSDIMPTVIDPPPPPPRRRLVTAKPPVKESIPKLPSLLCPSSMMYSNRMQTRQWLIRNHFSSNAVRTLPLL